MLSSQIEVAIGNANSPKKVLQVDVDIYEWQIPVSGFGWHPGLPDAITGGIREFRQEDRELLIGGTEGGTIAAREGIFVYLFGVNRYTFSKLDSEGWFEIIKDEPD